MSSSGLPFERTRYNPVQDVTREEAERNKRQQAKQEAALKHSQAEQHEAPPAKPDKATG